jgi:SAM-dependent methyltransferase
MVARVTSSVSSASEDGIIQHWLAFERHYDTAVAGQEHRLQEAAAITATDRVLDVGCGCGDSTRNAARSATIGGAFGVDILPEMITRARQRAAEQGLANATFDVGDVQVYPFVSGTFDVIISRHGATFCSDPVAAFTNLWKALRPGGRLAMIAWAPAEQNQWLQVIGNAVAPGTPLPTPPRDAPGPFGFADPRRAREVLGSAGLYQIDVLPVLEPMWLGTDANDAFAFVRGLGFVRGLLQGRDPSEVREAEMRLAKALASAASASGVQLGSAAWLITAQRR